MVIEQSGLYRGLRWFVALMPMGYRCGYVELPKGHPMYSKCYDKMPDEWHEAVNGGLTYSGHRLGDGTLYIGFDCIHAFNSADPDIAADEFKEFAAAHARTSCQGAVSSDEVAGQCKALADLICAECGAKVKEVRQ